MQEKLLIILSNVYLFIMIWTLLCSSALFYSISHAFVAVFHIGIHYFRIFSQFYTRALAFSGKIAYDWDNTFDDNLLAKCMIIIAADLFQGIWETVCTANS